MPKKSKMVTLVNDPGVEKIETIYLSDTEAMSSDHSEAESPGHSES